MEFEVKRVVKTGAGGTYIVYITDATLTGLIRYEVVVSNYGGSATANFSRVNNVRNATRPFVNVCRDVKGAKLVWLLEVARQAVAEKGKH